MISHSTQRSILRWTHIVLTIPILSYIYGDPSVVQYYATSVRFIFVPVIVLSGFWMYAGVAFAAIGVSVWLSVFKLFGFWPAVLGQVSLFSARRIWLVMRARRSK